TSGEEGGSTTRTWSQPMPKWRSARRRASAGVMSTSWVTASMTTKSLPRPCILVKRSSTALLRQQLLAAHHIVDGFAATHEIVGVAVDHDLGGAATGIVVGAHDKTVGAGGMQAQQIPGFEAQLPVLGEEIAGFAHRPDDVVAARFTA